MVYLTSTGVAASTANIFISTSNNVGIGTTSPGYLIDGEVNANISGGAQIRNSSTGTSAITAWRIGNGNGTNRGGIALFGSGYTSSSVYLQDGVYVYGAGAGGLTLNTEAAYPIYFATNNSERMRITSGGNVGIGTNPTSYTLQVVGSIGATADITAFTSDERLKSKTGPITDALDKVCTLDTFTYTHNDLARSFGFTDKRQYVGISAQQVRKVQPEVVRIAPFDADGEGSKSGQDYITVQYERLVPLLIEALKEERKAREALEERLERLEKLLEQK
jgi:hypothetical protein